MVAVGAEFVSVIALADVVRLTLSGMLSTTETVTVLLATVAASAAIDPNNRTTTARIENSFENFFICFSPISRAVNRADSRVTSGTEETFEVPLAKSSGLAADVVRSDAARVAARFERRGLRAKIQWQISLRADSNSHRGLRRFSPVSRCPECFARSQRPTDARDQLLRFALVAIERANALDAIQSSWRQSFGDLAGTNNVM